VNDQIDFGNFSNDDFADNPEPRCPCVLVLDTSSSMGGAPIQELNAGLQLFPQDVGQDDLAAKRVEVAIVTFGGHVTQVQDFTTVDNFMGTPLTASGGTPMGEALELAVQMVRDRKQTYKDNYIKYFRPWIFLITDGAPTDSIERAQQFIPDGENAKEFIFFAVGVEGADMSTLATLATKQAPLKLKGVNFRELFRWLSASMQQVSGEETSQETRALPQLTWAEVGG